MGVRHEATRQDMADGGHTDIDRTVAVVINGETRQIEATSLAGLLDALGYGEQKVATALNGDFIAARLRTETVLRPGDEIEIVAPRQGG